MSLQYAILSSGSVGNSYVFYDGEDSIVIDMGLTYKKFSSRLEEAMIPLDSLRAVFVTHLHPDHSKGVRLVATKHDLPVYLNTFSAKREVSLVYKYNINSTKRVFYTLGEILTVGTSFELTPFLLSHDSAGTVGYLIKSLKKNKSAILITDTGVFTDESLELARDADLVLLESNYDEEMLRLGPYPLKLQERIRGDRGHLSNNQAVEFVRSLPPSITRKIHLVHVSDSNNSLEKIEEAFLPLSNHASVIMPLKRGEFYSNSI